MKQKFSFNMSSNLKRSKLYFLAIAILSFVIIVISYNWNIKENIYKISRDISQIDISDIHLPDIKIRDRSLQTVLHVDKPEEITEHYTKATELEHSAEKKVAKDPTDLKADSSAHSAKHILTTDKDRNEGTEIVEKVHHKMNNKTVKPKNDSETEEIANSTDTVSRKGDGVLSHGAQSINSSQNGDTFRHAISHPQLGANESVKESVTKNIKKVSNILDSTNSNTFSTANQRFGQTQTKGNTVIDADSIKFSKKETQAILDKIHKLKSELLSEHIKSTDLKPKSKKRKPADNVTDRLFNNRLKHFNNFINPMLWMPNGNQRSNNYYSNIDSDVTSRPDVCAECFVNSFRKIINEPKICKDHTELIILITSTIARKDSRNAIRKTWCENCNKVSSSIKYVFVFGNRNDSVENAELLKESQQYHDIIQMDFHDTYANLTYKTISSLKWSKDYCQKAKYVMKTDDDMYINTELLPLMLKAAPDEKFMGGMCWGPSSPHRDLNSKWYVSFVQYRHSLFPSMCSGTGYVMSRDTVAGVLRQSPNVPFFHLEDVYVAICIKRLGLNPVLLDGFKNTLVEFEPCLYRNTLLTAHEVSADTLYYIWKKSRACRKADLTPEILYRAFPV